MVSRERGHEADRNRKKENRHNGGCQGAPAFKDDSQSSGGLFCQQQDAPKLPLQPWIHGTHGCLNGGFAP
jgi:hypothetical protein